MNGHIKVHRKIFEHTLLRKKHAARHFLFDLLAHAAWEDTVQDWGGKAHPVARGQVMMSLREMSEKFGPSIQTVRTLLANLASHDIIKINTLTNTATNKGPTVVTICNWDKYQASQQTTNTQSTQPPTNKRRKEESKKDSYAQNRFDEFWRDYPRKVAKAAAAKAYAKAIKKVDEETIIRAVRERRGGLRRDDPQYIPYASSWLNGERWTDKESNQQPADKQQSDSARVFDALLRANPLPNSTERAEEVVH